MFNVGSFFWIYLHVGSTVHAQVSS